MCHNILIAGCISFDRFAAKACHGLSPLVFCMCICSMFRLYLTKLESTEQKGVRDEKCFLKRGITNYLYFDSNSKILFCFWSNVMVIFPKYWYISTCMKSKEGHFFETECKTEKQLWITCTLVSRKYFTCYNTLKCILKTITFKQLLERKVIKFICTPKLC